MKIAIYLLLASAFATAQVAGSTAGATNQQTATSGVSTNAAPDPALNDLLNQVQLIAQKSNEDVGLLRVDKWKADSASKKEAEASALSIRRNLTNAVPDLVQKVQSAPGSLNANFRLYRNFNALYDTFSSLTESAGAFGSKDQYTPLAADISVLDQVRRQLADRVDSLAGANDAEVSRLRTQLLTAAANARPATKVVVDDDAPKPKKKAKTAQAKPQPDQK
jgi:hypothetical protein